jgi:uncharacterized membrane protein YhaH (DUF805 family)
MVVVREGSFALATIRAAMKLLDLLSTFGGRIGREQFWLALAIYAIALTVAIALGFVSESSVVMVALQLMVALACLVSLVAVGIKRLHDRNKSAWWLLVFYALPAVLPWLGQLTPAGRSADPDTVPMVIIVLVYVRFAILIWAVVELGCLRGTIGGNPYGPDPVAPKPARH